MTEEALHIEFEGNRIDTIPGVDLYNHDFTTLPRRQVKMHKIARRNLSIVTSAEYESKDIPVWADICGGSRAETELIITNVKALLQAQNGVLKAYQSGVLSQYTATLNEFNVTWNGPNAYCQMVFIASTPVGQAVDSEPLVTISGITSSSESASFTVGGSFAAQPVITLTITAVTGGTGGTINVINSITNQGIAVTSNFTAGDIVEIDCKNYKVLKNGSQLDYSGIFPSFPAGLQQISYSDTFTTRTVQLAATYNRRFV